MPKVGFLVNPIAGMGGKVGLKGTDGKVKEAISLGAVNVSFDRARLFLDNIAARALANIEWLTCGSPMGENLMVRGFNHRVVYRPKDSTSNVDTILACKEFLRAGCDLVVFCGGDGTARDVFSAVGGSLPLLGVPCGVKMLSGVFAINPVAAAELLELYVGGEASIKDAEIVDLDEDEYRKDNFAFKVYGIGNTLFEGNYMQASKTLIKGAEEEEIKKDIARTLIEDMDDETLYLLGAGSTLGVVGKELGIDKTLLGIDAVKGKRLLAKDLNEKGIMNLLGKHKDVKLVLSPIGAQGFIIGRGNLQITPRSIEAIGLDNILIVSTPAKLRTIKHLLVDTGESYIDDMFNKKRYLPVIIGYRTSTIKNIGIQSFK